MRTYGDVMNFLLRTYAMDEFITEAYNEIARSRQSFAMTQYIYFGMLWDKAFRCGTVFSDRRSKSLFT